MLGIMQDERPAAGAPRLARSSRLADEFLRHQIGNTLRRQRRAAGERRQQTARQASAERRQQSRPQRLDKYGKQ